MYGYPQVAWQCGDFIGERQVRQLSVTTNNKKILLVDDEQGIIDSISIVLKRRGYYCEGTRTPDAVEKVRNEHFDLIILDYLMVPIHGDEVVRRIRKFNSELYILLLTGYKELVPPLKQSEHWIYKDTVKKRLF